MVHVCKSVCVCACAGVHQTDPFTMALKQNLTEFIRRQEFESIVMWEQVKGNKS